MNSVTANTGTLYIMTFVAEKQDRLDVQGIDFPEVGRGEQEICKL